MSKVPIRRIHANTEKERVSTRLKDGHRETYEVIKCLACALDCTPTFATAFLIEASIKNTEFVNGYVKAHIEELDKGR